MKRKLDDYRGMTLDEFMWLLPKEERKEFRRYIAKMYMKKLGLEA